MPVSRQTSARQTSVCAAAFALLASGAMTPALSEVPYDGWRGQRAAEPAYAGGSDRRPLDGTPRYGQPYAPPRTERDMSAPPSRPAYRREPWTGFYLGGHLSGGWGSSMPKELSLHAIPLDGFTGGGQGGYNHKFGPFVAGVELDGSWAKVDGMRLYGGTANAAGINLDWMATMRGRLGVAWDNLLFYGTGGIAFGGIDVDVTTANGASNTRDKLTGFVYGAGVEMQINPQLSARIEALRYNFGDETLNTAAGQLSIGADVTSIRAGLNWHFN